MKGTKFVVLLVVVLILGIFLMGSLTNCVGRDEGYISRLVSEVLGEVSIVILIHFDLAALTWHFINFVMERTNLVLYFF